MLFPKELELANHYLSDIKKRNFGVTFSCDFFALETAVNNMQSEDCKVTPHFSTKVNTFARNEALWIGVWDGNYCIATIAAKLTRLDGEPLIDWITRYWQQTYGPGSENKFSLGQQQKAKLSKITGDTIYEGEFKIHKDFRARRETDNLEVFRRMDGMTLSLALLLRVYCFTFWRSAEFQYAYMADHHANMGLGSKHWFATQIPRALELGATSFPGRIGLLASRDGPDRLHGLC